MTLLLVLLLLSLAHQLLTRECSPTDGATKAAVNGLNRTIAQEHAKDGITANVICPGPVESRMEIARQQYDADLAGISLEDKVNSATPMGAHGQPEDIAPLALYFASDDSRFVTGQAWNVDGGILMAA